ncbi:MAG: glycerol-3-phosphate dehydrogenase/oxidase [Nitrospiria bacterium]
MTRTHYDIVVVGGGIHGAGVAQAAAASGYSVLVLEKSRIAAGTSSRSSKLIHGGLRYLETGHLALVRESLHERDWLLRNAPALVKKVPFYIPVYQTSRRSSLKIGLGLSLYAILGGFRESLKFRQISQRRWTALDGLKTEGLDAVYQYWDAQTDDRALTGAVMHSARSLGATLLAPARFEEATLEKDGYRILYHYQESRKTCLASTLVNAAGPWVHDISSRIQPPIPKIKIDLIQGTHILLDGPLSQSIYYLESHRDKRPVFVTPWKGRTLVGTTETVFTGDPDKVEPLESEKSYLLETLSFYFPHHRSTSMSQIYATFAGLRVLPSGNDKPGKRSRETVLMVDDADRPRCLTIYGGKLTTYRSTAHNVLKRLGKSLPTKTSKADTRRLRLKPVHGDETRP